MTICNLYKYNRPDGGITVSLDKPDVSYTILYRIIADENKLVTKDGIKTYNVIDVNSSDDWYEIDEPVEETSF